MIFDICCHFRWDVDRTIDGLTDGAINTVVVINAFHGSKLGREQQLAL